MPRNHTPLRVRNATRREDEPSGSDRVLIFSHAKDVLTFENVEKLVLVTMDVQRCVHQRRDLLEKGERAAGCVRSNAHQDRHVPEDETFPRLSIQSVGGGWLDHQSPIGCQTVLCSRNASISHGLWASSEERTTRFTFSAAERSSSVVEPSMPVTSIAFTSM